MTSFLAHGTAFLRCETVLEGGLIYVLLPISEELLGDERAREYADARAREELWYACVRRTGRDLTKAQFDALPVWVERPDSCVVECVGGPHDGKRVTMSGEYPPPVIHMAVETSMADLMASADVPPADLFRQVLYRPLINEHGFSSRSTDGAWRYQLRP